MIQHLEAILIILGQLAVWAFYAMFAVAGVVMYPIDWPRLIKSMDVK
jgi:hypothetical protein